MCLGIDGWLAHGCRDRGKEITPPSTQEQDPCHALVDYLRHIIHSKLIFQFLVYHLGSRVFSQLNDNALYWNISHSRCSDRISYTTGIRIATSLFAWRNAELMNYSSGTSHLFQLLSHLDNLVLMEECKLITVKLMSFFSVLVSIYHLGMLA